MVHNVVEDETSRRPLLTSSVDGLPNGLPSASHSERVRSRQVTPLLFGSLVVLLLVVVCLTTVSAPSGSLLKAYHDALSAANQLAGPSFGRNYAVKRAVPTLQDPVCPTVSVDLRRLPHLAVNTTVSYLVQFRILRVYSWRELMDDRRFPFPWMQHDVQPTWTTPYSENVTATGWTVRPEDPGQWFHVLPTGLHFERVPRAIRVRPTLGTRGAMAIEDPRRDLDDLAEMRRQMRKLHNRDEIDYDDRRGPIWPLPEDDHVESTLQDGISPAGWWVFGEPHLIWQPCSAAEPPVFHDSRTASVSPFLTDSHAPQPSKLRILVFVMSTKCDMNGTIHKGTSFAELITLRHAYARIHGYGGLTACRKELKDTHATLYSKITTVMEVFTQHARFMQPAGPLSPDFKEFDYIWFSDWDTAIMNPRVRAEAFIPSHLPDHIYTDHHIGLNDGSFLFRTTPRSWRFLQHWRHESYKYQDWPWADNGSWNHLILTFLDRHPVFYQECPHDILLLKCVHLEWMEDQYNWRYHRRFSQYSVAIPAMVGFNSHVCNEHTLSWGWMMSSNYWPDRGMFAMHGKDDAKMMEYSKAGWRWEIRPEDYEANFVHDNKKPQISA